MTFYERMQSLLIPRGMTAADLSRIINISQPSINGWKNGSCPRADIACKVADTLNTSVEFLVNGINKENVSPEEVSILQKLRSLSPSNFNAVISLLDTLYEQETKAPL